MLVDEVTMTLRAGRGGRGAVAFNKVKLMQGPTAGAAPPFILGVSPISMR